MASKKAAAAAKDAPEVPEGHVFVYPTYKRQSGPLVVGLPAIDGNSDELVIDESGAAVPKALADHLIAGGEATTKAPKAPETEE